MFGPFQPGDLVPQIVRNVEPGALILAGDHLLLVATWPADDDGPQYDYVVRFTDAGLPELEPDQLNTSDRCLMVMRAQFEVTLTGVGCRATPGCLGVNKEGGLMLTLPGTMGPASSRFVHLGSGVISVQAPADFVWSSTWRLDLVLGDAQTRIRLGKRL